MNISRKNKISMNKNTFDLLNKVLVCILDRLQTVQDTVRREMEDAHIQGDQMRGEADRDRSESPPQLHPRPGNILSFRTHQMKAYLINFTYVEEITHVPHSIGYILYLKFV